MQQHTKAIGWTIFFALVHLVGTAHAQMSGPRLWLVDNGVRTVYEVTMDVGVPVLDRSLPPAESARSSIAVDPFDGTLWGASETRSATPRGSVVNYGKDGSLIQVIRAELFGA